jgi:hypothetical protein
MDSLLFATRHTKRAYSASVSRATTQRVRLILLLSNMGNIPPNVVL